MKSLGFQIVSGSRTKMNEKMANKIISDTERLDIIARHIDAFFSAMK